MTKSIKSITGIIIIIVMTAMLIIPASAMGFSVTPDLPDNQRKNGSAFFDLLVVPGMQQEISIRVSNPSSQEITVLVELITASTAMNGQINYTAPGEMDSTLQYSFEDIAEIPQSNYTIPARSEIDVPIKLKMPNGRFDGAILGSIRVLREATAEEREAAGALVNQYAQVIAVRLVQSENAEAIISPNFEIGEITTELVNYRASIIANIRNTEPILIKGARATAKIYHNNSSVPTFESIMENVDFAPNSIFPYSFVDREGVGIDSGDYNAVITIEYQNETWTFEESFTVTAEAAVIVNESALNQNIANSGSDIPLWAQILMGMGALIIVAIIIALVIIIRKKSKVSVEDLLKEFELKKALGAFGE